MILKRTLLALAVLCSTLFSAAAQTWTDEQREVWTVIDAQWKAAKAKDYKFDQFLHPKFVGWETDAPAPDDAKSVPEWSRFHDHDSTTLVQKLTPLAIVVHGTTAVAHYYYSEGREHAKTGRKVVQGRYTDILVKENGKWVFLAWAGGQKPEKAE